MWEWRKFFPEMEIPSWDSIIEEKLLNVVAEIRSDLYLNLNSPNYGLKIRSYLNNSQLLELKELRTTNENYELWEKTIKAPIYNNSMDEIVRILKNYSVSEKILPILSEREINFIKLEKERKKLNINQVTVERTIVKYHNKSWYSIEIESHNFKVLAYFLKNILNIDQIEGNTSYPEFLMQYF